MKDYNTPLSTFDVSHGMPKDVGENYDLFSDWRGMNWLTGAMTVGMMMGMT